MSELQVQVDEAIAARIRISDAIKVKEREFKDLKASYKDQMLTIDQFLLGTAKNMGVNSLQTDEGTAFIDHPDFVSVSDWMAFLNFLSNAIACEVTSSPEAAAALAPKIFESDVWLFFNKTVNKTAIKEFMKDQNGITPVGIEYGMKEEMKIRRPTKRKEK